MNDKEFEITAKKAIEQMKREVDERKALVEEAKRTPHDPSKLLTIIEQLTYQIDNLLLYQFMTTLIVKDLSDKRDNREGNIEMLNQLMADLIEKTNEHHEIYEKFKDYFENIDLMR